MIDEVTGIKRYRFIDTSLMLVKLQIFRSGYTGEDGVEIVLSAKAAGMALKMLSSSLNKENATIMPAGFRHGIRCDLKRACHCMDMRLRNPSIRSRRSDWAVDLSKDFIGVEALRVISEKGPARKLVGLELDGKRIARQGTPVLSGATMVGEVTSGTLGPTCRRVLRWHSSIPTSRLRARN